MTAPDGIVLDAVTAPLVAEFSTVLDGDGDKWVIEYAGQASPDDTLTHVPTPTGPRPVGEVVAVMDRLLLAARTAKDAYEVGAERHECWGRIADELDAIAERLLAPEFVQAWHDQHSTPDWVQVDEIFARRPKNGGAS